MDPTETEKLPLAPPAENMYPAVPEQQANPPPYSGYPAQPQMMGQQQMIGQQPMMMQQPMMAQQPMMMQQPVQMQPIMNQTSTNMNTNTNVTDVKVNVIAPTVESARSYGTNALMCGIILSAIYFFCGCWHGLPCTLIAIYFAFSASSAKDNEEGRKYNSWSMRCSSISIAVIIGLDALGIIIGIAVSVGGAASLAS